LWELTCAERFKSSYPDESTSSINIGKVAGREGTGKHSRALAARYFTWRREQSADRLHVYTCGESSVAKVSDMTPPGFRPRAGIVTRASVCA
jgi:hypothetical protein